MHNIFEVSKVKLAAGSRKLPEKFFELPSRKYQKLPAHEEVLAFLKFSEKFLHFLK